MTKTTAPASRTSQLPDGIFEPTDQFVAEALLRLAGVTDDDLHLAIALVVKAVRNEHVCIELDDDGIAQLWHDDDVDLDDDQPEAPDPGVLLASLRARPALCEVVDAGADVDPAGAAPLVLSGPRLYLRRYAVLEQDVADHLRASRDEDDDAGSTWAPEAVEGVLGSLGADADPSQLEAVRRALRTPVAVIAGGPGTGKTTTIALLLRAVLALEVPVRVALAAPTGKAASRLNEAVRGALAGFGDVPAAVTLHRLLGLGLGTPGRVRRPLDCDLVVVDEASMVSLPLLAELFSRVRPGSTVVLVGDPDQLASIEVGAVLADVVAAVRGGDTHGVEVSWLTTGHRFEDASGVGALADAVRSGEADAVADVARQSASVSLADPASAAGAVLERAVAHASLVVAAASAGDGAGALELATSFGLLCATRQGPGSTTWWRRAIERGLEERGEIRARDVDYVGRPVLVTRNDPLTGLMNGDVGVVVSMGSQRVCLFDNGTHPLSSVPNAETVWSLTIHKSQGSEYDEVVVSLPAATSPILTRELLYTAVTRARRTVTLLAPPGSLEAALARRVARSSGLAARLQRAPTQRS